MVGAVGKNKGSIISVKSREDFEVLRMKGMEMEGEIGEEGSGVEVLSL